MNKKNKKSKKEIPGWYEEWDALWLTMPDNLSGTKQDKLIKNFVQSLMQRSFEVGVEVGAALPETKRDIVQSGC